MKSINIEYKNGDKLMEYVIIVVLSLIVGTMVNIVCNYNELKQNNLLLNLINNSYRNVRYIAVIAVTVFSYILIYIKYETKYEIVSAYILLIILLISAVTDIKSSLISNRLIIVGLVLGLILKIITFDLDTIKNSVIFCLATGGILFIVSYVSKGGLGMGDVKLMAVFSLFMDTTTTITVFLMSLILTAVSAIILLLLKKTGMKQKIPFAPFLLAGFIVYAMFL